MPDIVWWKVFGRKIDKNKLRRLQNGHGPTSPRTTFAEVIAAARGAKMFKRVIVANLHSCAKVHAGKDTAR